MRTTLDVEDTLFRRAKALASLRGVSLKRFFTEAIERELERDRSPAPARRRIALPLVRSSSPGSISLDAERIAEILDEDELNASS